MLAKLRAAQSEPQPARFSPKEVTVIVVATVLALAGVFADDMRIVFPCLIISLLGFVYLCYMYPGSLRWRASVGIVITAVYALMIFHVYRRGLEREQNDVYANLAVQAFMPRSGNVLRTGIVATNGGSSDIRDHSVLCVMRRGTYAPYGGFVNMGMQTTLPQKAPWRAHGGGETSYCFAGIQEVPPDMHVICADITISILYTLEAQPHINKTKQFRFVATGEDFLYRQQPVDYPGDFCPELRSPPQQPFF